MNYLRHDLQRRTAQFYVGVVPREDPAALKELGQSLRLTANDRLAAVNS
jgi:hypothetical protein